jgi:glycosyltransferase involved in cell wall biosynthesis
MYPPKVSVIILTYNRAHLLCKAIQSVLNQNFQDFEIIIVDDASQDNTTEVVNSFSDKRIRYIRHQANRGEGGSRNSGVKNATGEYIAFLDDDDEWLPEKLSMQVLLLDNSPLKVGAVHTGCVEVDIESGEKLFTKITTMRGYIFQELLHQKDFITVSSILLRRICFEKSGLFDESISYGLDYDMWLRISREFNFECIKTPLVKYGVHKNHLGSNYSLQINGREAILKKYHQDLLSDKKGYSRIYYTLGILCCLNKEPKKGRGFFLCAIHMNVYWIKPYILLCFSLLYSNVFKEIYEINKNIKLIHYHRKRRYRKNKP